MSRLKDKSEINIDAAQILFKNSLYAPCVHCAYYSCFQLLKYTIKSFFGIDYETLSANIGASEQNTHTYVINYVSRELISLGEIEKSREFNRKIKDLRQFRIESDYDDVSVDSEKGDSALRKAKEIRYFITSNFNI